MMARIVVGLVVCWVMFAVAVVWFLGACGLLGWRRRRCGG